MSGINSIYNVSSSLPQGYQANIREKTLVERMQAEHPGMLEKVAEKIDSTLDNALMAIRVESRFTLQKNTLTQMNQKWLGGGYKANFSANLDRAEKAYFSTVSPKMQMEHKATDKKMQEIIETNNKTGEQKADPKDIQAYLAAEKSYLYSKLKMPLMPREKISRY